MHIYRTARLLVGACFLLSGLAWGATHEWVLPWLSNKDGEWGSRIIISNSGDSDAQVTLKAVRNEITNGSSNFVVVTKTIMVIAGHTTVVDMTTQFSEFNNGGGYGVFISSEEGNLKTTAVVFSKNTASGNSPAAAEAIPMDEASPEILFNYMPVEEGAFAGAAVSNPNEDAVTVTFNVYRNGAVIGSSTKSIEGQTSFAALVSDMTGGATGDMTITASADAPIVGMSFVFNGLREPSMVRALPDEVRIPKIDPIDDNDYPATNLAKETLGKMLFFDKILSGNQNISCATCHHPLAFTGDGLSLPTGEGAAGLGVTRNTGSGDDAIHERVPRNAPHVFASGHSSFTRMFHDGRVAIDDTHPAGFSSPAGEDLLPGLDSLLSAQAMFPVTSDTEMRGQGDENDISIIDGSDLPAIWAALTARVMALDDYQDLFRAAYPELTVPEDVTFAHIANAIAAFEANAWRSNNSDFDAFLQGDKAAMSKQAVRGMSLFYGKAGCGECHSGALQTDQDFHAVAMPQVGPGKGHGPSGREDYGREGVTGNADDRYKFRTPTLRNIALTAPYGHDGAYNTLEAVVRHMMDPVTSNQNYDPSQLVMPSREDLDAIDLTVHNDAALSQAIRDANELEAVSLTDREVDAIIAFLHALTDRDSIDLRKDAPAGVPSGLPLFD